MVIIRRLQWRKVRIPFRDPYATARSTAMDRHALLLWLTTSDGLTGVGEASPVGAGTRAGLDALDQCLRQAATKLVGVDPIGALDLLASMNSATPELRFGLETALYDLLGKQSGQPLATLLGGSPRRVEVNATITSQDMQHAVRLTREAVLAGISTIKLKVGAGSAESDKALVRAVREAAGEGARLRVDANGAWTVDEAVRTIQLLAPLGLEYVEQPVADAAGLAQVRQAVGVPIAADESLANADDARRLLETAAADVLVIKAAQLGGLRQAMVVIGLAFDANLSAVVTSSMETGVGLAASLHLAGMLSPAGPACGLATAALLEHDLLENPIPVEHGALLIPSAPGLGVTVDAEAVEWYAIGLEGNVEG
jgi:o-succinylbenzoate synthase